MTTYQQGVEAGLRDLFCSALKGGASIANKIGSVVPPAKLGAWVAYGLAGWVCDIPPDDFSLPSGAPYDGGQCITNYDISLIADVIISNTGQVVSDNFVVTANAQPGPITSIQVNPGNDNQILVANGNGVEPIVNLSLSFQGFSNLRDIVVVRSDGQPDDCGNVPLDGNDPGPVEFPDTPITYDDPNGNPVTDLEDVILYDPYFNVEGDLNITVKIGELFGDLEIFPDFRFRPRINFGGNGSKGEECGTPPPDIPEEDAPEVIEDEKPSIIGVVLKSERQGDQQTTEVFQGSAPTLIVPRVANVYFGAVIAEEFCWSGAIPVQVLRGYVGCPFPDGASAVRVAWSTGWDGSYVRVYEKPEEPDTLNDQPVCT